MIRAALILAIGLGAGAHLKAQEDEKITVKAILEESQSPVGVSTLLKVKVEGGEGVFPTIFEAPGLEVENYGVNRKVMVVNGNRIAQSDAFYGITGHETGTFQIPAISVTVRGKEYLTEPLTIEIIQMSGDAQRLDSTRPQFLNFNVGKMEAYVNELIPVECNLYVRGSNSIGRASFPKFDNSEKFVVRPFPNKYTNKVELIDGIPYTTVRFPTSIAALSPGEHQIGPAVITAKVTSQVNSGIPSPLIQLSQPKTVTSNSQTLTIKPLPLAGKPESFTGAVGRFEISTQATPTELKIGDPISLSIQVSGVGNFDSLSQPSLPSGKGWKVYPSNRVEEDERSDLEQMVRFSQVVIPTEEQTELPPLELAYFDPAAEEYRVVQSAPITLSIEPDPLAAAAAAQATLEQIGIRGEQLSDILFIESGPARWQNPHGSILDRPLFWILQLVPALGMLAILLLAYRQWSQEAAARKAAQKHPSPGELRSRLGHERVNRGVFYTMLLDCFERAKGEYGDILSRFDQQGRAAWDRLYRQGNSILYSGTDAATQPVSREERSDAMLALKELEAIAEAA